MAFRPGRLRTTDYHWRMATHVKQAIASLSTPCTIQQLRVWLQKVDTLAVGDEDSSTINTTSSTITIA